MPKLSASNELVWQLACREAIAGRFAAIEPEHFFMALLKLAELPTEQIEKMCPNGAHIGRELAQDVQSTRHAIEALGLDPTQARRRLRKALGKGSAAYDGGEMHRSANSRTLFDETAKLADDSGSDAMTPTHLFAALTAKPTRMISDILLAGGDGVPIDRKPPGLLAEWGTDLTAMAAKGELVDKSGRTAECKAIFKALQSPTRKGVFLVSGSADSINEVMVSLACAAATDKSRTRSKRLQVIDLTTKPAPATANCTNLDLLQQLLSCASQIDNLVLRIPDIQGAKDAGEILAMLKATLSSANPSWICRVGDEVYRQHIQQDPCWRRAATVIVLQQSIARGIPNEL